MAEADNEQPGPEKDYGAAYSEESFWKKVGAFARTAGIEVVEKALILYFCLRDGDTPAAAKAIIASALGYFIVPMDVIPDITPVAGFADDLGALAMAFAAVVLHVKPEHRSAAKEKAKEWFGND